MLKIVFLIFQLEHAWIPIFAYPEMLSSSLIDCLAMGVQQNYKPPSLEYIHAQHTSYNGNSNVNGSTCFKTVLILVETLISIVHALTSLWQNHMKRILFQVMIFTFGFGTFIQNL